MILFTGMGKFIIKMLGKLTRRKAVASMKSLLINLLLAVLPAKLMGDIDWTDEDFSQLEKGRQASLALRDKLRREREASEKKGQPAPLDPVVQPA